MGRCYNGEGAATTMSVLCASKSTSSRSTAAAEEGGRVVYCIFPGGRTLVESMSPGPAVGHEEQHLADAAEAILQRGEGQERQLGSAF